MKDNIKEQRDFINLVKGKNILQLSRTDSSFIKEYMDITNRQNEESKPTEINFQNTDTVGIFTFPANYEEEKKNAMRDLVEELFESASLVVKTVQVNILNGKVVILSDSIISPIFDGITKVKFDTSLDYPSIEVVGGELKVNQDVITLFNGMASYVGGDFKNKLIFASK